jgi:hypothetical protein
VGQRTFETRSLYLILAEMLFTLPAANEMLPLSALFAGKYRDRPGSSNSEVAYRGMLRRFSGLIRWATRKHALNE